MAYTSTYEASPAFGLPSQPMGVPNAQTAAPPLPMEMLAGIRVTGYEGVNFQQGDCHLPPAYQHMTTQVAQSTAPPPQIPTHVSNDGARQSLMQLAGSNCCWGSKPAQEMDITSITSSNAFHYKLETFTEGRKAAWTYEPYVGQIIDGPANGLAPTPWDVMVQPKQMFHDHHRDMEVPHTACVQKCHDCRGTGKIRCKKCSGNGKSTCNHCHGHGQRDQRSESGETTRVPCQHCNKTGKVTCGVCSGVGKVDCSTCKAHGKLKCYIKLTVTWKTHSSDHIVETTALPDSLIRTAGGHVVFENSGVRVAPVSNFQNSSINNGSQRLVQQHSTAFPNLRILMQRHNVRVVPVSEVTSEYKSQRFTYWVYGTGNTAYAPDYPQKCCCGCSIL